MFVAGRSGRSKEVQLLFTLKLARFLSFFCDRSFLLVASLDAFCWCVCVCVCVCVWVCVVCIPSYINLYGAKRLPAHNNSARIPLRRSDAITERSNWRKRLYLQTLVAQLNALSLLRFFLCKKGLFLFSILQFSQIKTC